MPIEPQPGEVWYADLGLAEKSRPVLILAYPRTDNARSLVIRHKLARRLGTLSDEQFAAVKDALRELLQL